ncbi:MAG: hypothetical protein ACK55I_44795, partial [bacterium]
MVRVVHQELNFLHGSCAWDSEGDAGAPGALHCDWHEPLTVILCHPALSFNTTTATAAATTSSYSSS